MKNKKPPKPKPTIPAWECPRCGRTHPITTQTCECIHRYRAASTRTPPFPFDTPQWSDFPIVWCGGEY